MSDERPVTILIVDDNPATRYSTARLLRAAGFTVIEAATGGEALDLALKGPDAIVLDVNLPDIDGFEVCARLRAREQTARTPIIHLSATFVGDVDKVHGLEAGADGYLTHPVEPPVLIATVNAFLRARQAEAERERLLASERAARAEAERANRLKDDFLATLSHELRTPLNAILGWAQLLSRGTVDDPEDLREGLDSITRSGHALAQLISDLLDVSRITSGKLLLELRTIDPAATVAAALEAVMPAAQAKGIAIDRFLDPAAGPIVADAARLQQVIWNLVNNAVKFTPRGGAISIRLGRAQSQVEISVSDNGEGINTAFLPHLFERFRQENATPKRNHGGLGLGLAIVKHLVEMHGGTVVAHSGGEGTGSTFTIRLPITAVQAPGDKAGIARGGSHLRHPAKIAFDPIILRGKRILVIDDDLDARILAKRLLVEFAADVAEADNVRGALDLLEKFRPQILVSDIGMPREDGYDLIRTVRARGYDADKLPAIALTAFARTEDRDQALARGFQMHLAKPVDANELLNAIARLLEQAPGANRENT